MSDDEQILSALYKAGMESVALPQLAAQTGLSNARLGERIEALSKLGYVIEQHPHAGCRLLESPDRLLADDLRSRLGNCQTGSTILVFNETSSTNDVVNRMAEEDHAEGLVVIAESQTAGRGRQGRKWFSPSGKGLWFSVLLRPELALESSSRLMVMTAVAVATALRRDTGLPLCIKWPNDILCCSRKAAGILVELNAEGGKIRHAVIGIGIDVNLEKSDFPEWLHMTATSLKMESKNEFHRPTLLISILHELDQTRQFLTDERFPHLIQRWIELDETLGRQVFMRGNERQMEGLAVNMDLDGALLVRTDDGRMERVTAGDVNIGMEI